MTPVTSIIRHNDTFDLADLDLRSYHFPQDSKYYQDLVGKANMTILRSGKVGVAFAVWVAEQEGKILRLGVRGDTYDTDEGRKYRYRRLGIGNLLLNTAFENMRISGCKKVTVVVPEIHCMPGDSDDVSVWLNAAGFRAKGIKNGEFLHYGKYYDGFVFERGVEPVFRMYCKTESNQRDGLEFASDVI